MKYIITSQPYDLVDVMQSLSLISEQMHWSKYANVKICPSLVFTRRGENNSNNFQPYNSDEMLVAEDNPP